MYAPNGGFGAIGSSFGIGLPVKPAGRSRTAVAGLKRNGVESMLSRSGEMSSMTQNARPCVAMTRSSPCTSISRTDVTGRFICSDCQ